MKTKKPYKHKVYKVNYKQNSIFYKFNVIYIILNKKCLRGSVLNIRLAFSYLPQVLQEYTNTKFH